ncbi:hypothetical protein PBY51_024131 [Eleginops maclovinus]|uniref:Uncharacterized protein n=1 Tax=Eleginops maclovinus TaxID=56733 RepID=A0AAN8AVP6_ELEMC|nr:hypothetical protein PBY51_024131 [Eleginops maclovinus]
MAGRVREVGVTKTVGGGLYYRSNKHWICEEQGLKYCEHKDRLTHPLQRNPGGTTPYLCQMFLRSPTSAA